MVLSIGMIVKNEEKYLEKCLTALKPILENVDSELIIADTGSTDKTVDIAKKFTDNVFHFEWSNDFAAARNFTMEKSQGEWYMFLDADEIFQDCSDIIRFFNSREYKNYSSATVVIRSYSYENRPDFYLDFRAYRLTYKRDDVKFVNPIHEGLLPTLPPCKNLDLIADHYGYMYYDEKGVVNEIARSKSERNLKLLFDEYDKLKKNGDTIPEAFYSQVADCYGIINEREKALEYVNKGLENVDKSSLFRILYYSHKTGILASFFRYEEVIEICDEYFSKENEARKMPLATDCFIYGSRGLANFQLGNIEKSIPDLLKCVELYRQYLDNKLITADLLLGIFRATVTFMKTIYNLLYKSCIHEKRYETVAAASKLFPVKQFENDKDYMATHLYFRVDIMEHTSFSKLADLYYQLDDYDRKQLIRIMRWHIFKTDKHVQILKKFCDIAKGDEHLTAVLDIFNKHFVKNNLCAEDIAEFISKYGTRDNEDVWCVMMLAGYDVASYILANDFNAEASTKSVYVNYLDNQSAADLFANYDVSCISANALEKAASIYGRAMVGAQQNKLDISALFEKFGQVGLCWFNAFRPDSGENIPGDIRAAIMVSQITALRRNGEYLQCIELMGNLARACPAFIPTIKYYEENIKSEIESAQAEPQYSDEFTQLAAQLKQNIRAMIDEGNTAEAKATLAELEQLCPEDPEINELKELFNINPIEENISDDPKTEITENREENASVKEIVVINSDNAQIPDFGDDMFTVRNRVADIHESAKNEKYEATIVVVAYNRLDKTKECIENILKYTKGINYNLILIDNGSTDGTFEYFKALEYDKTYILRFTKNIGGNPVLSFINFRWVSEYLIFVPNDLIVTEHWLDNMLTIARSDKKIGMVNPMSTNVSNCQQTDIVFTTLEDFQKKAAAFNKSDPAKWQERLRLVTLATLFTKECLLAVGHVMDCGFVHDFGDDEISFRVRRAGYKAVLAGDVVIHHNHDFRNLEGKDPVKFQQSLETGRKNFQKKFLGVDAWDDVNNFVFPIIGNAISKPADKNGVKILGIDTRCGTPVLDIKNLIRRYGVFDPEISAFTCDAKYYTDLKTFCNGKVVCDRIEYMGNSFDCNIFDYIIIEKSINEYHNPEDVVKTAFSLLKKGGEMFLPLKNVFSARTLVNMLGVGRPDAHGAVPLDPDIFAVGLRERGIVNVQMFITEDIAIDQKSLDSIRNIINALNQDNVSKKGALNKLSADRYWFKIVK